MLVNNCFLQYQKILSSLTNKSGATLKNHTAKNHTAKKHFAFISLIILLNSQNAFALPIAFIPQGSKAGTSSGIVSFASGDNFVVNSQIDHSTYCKHRSPTEFGDVNFSMTISSTSGGWSAFDGRLVGNIGAGADSSLNDNDAIAFTAPGSDTMVVTLSTVSPNPSNLIIECFNTTLFGNFNTVAAANPFNFLEITNDTNSTATALVVLRNNAGTELARFPVSLNPYQQRDISIHDIAGASNTFGSILVSHNTIPNGIRASVSKYRLSAGAFIITATNPLVSRPNEL